MPNLKYGLEFECGTCGKDFPDGLLARDNHCLSTGHFPPELECDRCSRWFLSENARWQHMENMNHFEWECFQCGETYPYEDDLQEHVSSKLCSRLQCEDCNRTFNSLQALENHDVDKHFWCKECDRFFQDQSAIDQHLNSTIHCEMELDDGMNCPFCSRFFISAAAVAQHLESGGCPSAPKLNRDQLYKIIRAKDPQGVLTKQLIGWAGCFATTYEFVATEETFNGRQYECYMCNSEFPTLPTLTAHINSETHQQKLYHCPQAACQREFTSLGAFVQHLESETCGFMTFGLVQKKFGDIIEPGRRLEL